MILGITGPYCSGKNTFSARVSSLGFEILDVDHVGHLSLEGKKEEIIKAFGPEIVEAFPLSDPLSDPLSGSSSPKTETRISRRKLGKIVFSNSKKLQQLESIVHPWMKQHIKEYIHKNKEKHLAINAALLFFLELDQYCDLIVILRTNKLLRFFRALARDKLGVLQTRKRMKHEKRNPSKKSFKYYKNNAELYYVSNTKESKRCLQSIEGYIHGKLHTANQ